MTTVFVCADFMVNASILCLCFTATHRSHSWCDGMEVIAYNTRSPLVLIRYTMAAQRYIHGILQPHVLPLMERLPGVIFSKTMFGLTRQGCQKTLSALLLPFFGLLNPQFYLQSIISGIHRDSELSIP
ncbi:transposable element Tcb2 transposase [Trichonephila clavipes]|nr:transposable element Tcb2 transposase [Trichonephila clavipes]